MVHVICQKCLQQLFTMITCQILLLHRETLFQNQHVTTTLLVQCNKKKAKIPTSITYSSVTVISNEQNAILKNAIENTIDYITSDLVSLPVLSSTTEP